ncbi:MAG: 16S rRNA (guanine(527)-N(7))-methyltransferase RsmG [Bacilli bacterium]|nr:16S rRNA (guanine(527)-N(7))-methyltransferase RsmG [Bacilli bacterium]
MNKDEFINEIKNLNIEVTDEKLSKLEEYYNLLIEWNEKINLTAITNKEDVYLKHFYDSLTIIKAYDLNQELNICDVGTGAGFPGIVLKIFFPNLKITLVDALNKRIIFLNEVVNKLDLKDIIAVHTRAEDFAKKHIEEFDIVTSRAVAKLNILNELCVPMVKVEGYFIAMKANIDEELEKSKNSLKKLDCKLEEVISFSLPIENSVRNIVKIKKIKKTKEKYPRKFDKISKNPL